MATKFDASGDILKRTANLPAPSAFTLCAWVRVVSVRSGQYQYFIELANGTSSAGSYLVMGYRDTGTFEIATGANYQSFASNPTTGTWMFVGLTSDGTTLRGYFAHAGNAFTTASMTTQSFTSAQLSIGNDSWNEYCDVEIENVLVYDAALTQAELEQQMYRALPVRMANLNIWSRLQISTDVTDFSGNGRNWTSGGTLASASGPALAWGAPVLALPYAAAAGGSTYENSLALAAGLAAGNSGLMVASAGLTLAGGLGYGDGGNWTGGGAVSLPAALTAAHSGLMAAGGAVGLPSALGLAGGAVLSAGGALALGAALGASDGASLDATGAMSLAGALAAQATAGMVAEANAALAAQLAQAQAALLLAGGSVALDTVLAASFSGALGPSTYEATLVLAQLQSVTTGAEWLANATVALSASYAVQMTGGSVVDGSVALPAVFAVAQAGTLAGVAAVQLAAGLAVSMQSQADAIGGVGIEAGLGATAASIADASVSTVLAATVALTTAGTMTMLSSIAVQLAAGILAGGSVFSGAIVTPDGRTVQVSVEARVVTVADDGRVIAVPNEDRSVEA